MTLSGVGAYRKSQCVGDNVTCWYLQYCTSHLVAAQME